MKSCTVLGCAALQKASNCVSCRTDPNEYHEYSRHSKQQLPFNSYLPIVLQQIPDNLFFDFVTYFVVNSNLKRLVLLISADCCLCIQLSQMMSWGILPPVLNVVNVFSLVKKIQSTFSIINTSLMLPMESEIRFCIKLKL